MGYSEKPHGLAVLLCCSVLIRHVFAALISTAMSCSLESRSQSKRPHREPDTVEPQNLGSGLLLAQKSTKQRAHWKERDSRKAVTLTSLTRWLSLTLRGSPHQTGQGCRQQAAPRILGDNICEQHSSSEHAALSDPKPSNLRI